MHRHSAKSYPKLTSAASTPALARFRHSVPSGSRRAFSFATSHSPPAPRRPAPEEIPPLQPAATRRGEVDLDRLSSDSSNRPADADDDASTNVTTTTPTPTLTSATATQQTPASASATSPAAGPRSHPRPVASDGPGANTNIESYLARSRLPPPPPPPPILPFQILGRRQRSASPSPDAHGAPLASAAASSGADFQEPQPKRRRRTPADMVAADNNGTASNGAVPQPTANGTSSRAANGNTANGDAKPSIAMNGSSAKGKRVGAGPDPETYLGHNREEVTRILIQALTDMGYQTAAESVSHDSGFNLENPTVAAFRSSVLQGAWDETEDLLNGATTLDEQGELGNGLVLAAGSDRSTMRFWVRQQKYLELLELRDTSRALMALRNDLTPLSQDTEKLRLLSSLLMCRSTDDLMSKANWDGAQGRSRHRLLSELSKCISPSVMLPENRLAVLLDHVKKSQIDTCLYHTAASSPSLYSDHSCERRNFPTEVALELTNLEGEAWQVQFSHDGSRLAACGSSTVVTIWETTRFSVICSLRDHDSGVGNISWSPDDTMLVTCSQDRFARLWDARSGALIKALPSFDQPVSGCLWAADSRSFVLGGLSRSHGLCTFLVHGDEIQEWDREHRVQDLALSPDGRWLVALDDQNTFHVYNAKTREFIYSHELKARPTSVSISEDSKHMLLNKHDGEAQLIEIETRVHKQKFLGHTGGQFLIRSSFGGANEGFVVSGSEDGNILIWHKNTGAAVERLPGHKPRCNAVAWNPADPCMLASAGDDSKVKIWSNKTRAAELRALHGNVS
ncbi:WD domain protein [Cordyceps fumosorosea ARSEF 2679]|uniref:WD domain protein n=1 Tax=Cordyceps fumosorosea (strain ARSEF 2679) TaxID=1081104 RepID=A0A162JAH1_CORFA|nr:WD domain protein [Cordyceps fumosorosea ARSEF 2679]OAA66082.1 WD domain protein [Cordyceps fumosorosea ARSEF 2679]